MEYAISNCTAIEGSEDKIIEHGTISYDNGLIIFSDFVFETNKNMTGSLTIEKTVNYAIYHLLVSNLAGQFVSYFFENREEGVIH